MSGPNRIEKSWKKAERAGNQNPGLDKNRRPTPEKREAEARTIGKITQALTQIAPLAIKGAQLGTQAALVAKRALDAKRAGRYLSLAKVGSKIMGPTSGAIIG